MVNWKKNARYAGVTASALALGVVGVEAAGAATPSSSQLLGIVTSVGNGQFSIRTSNGTESVTTTPSTSLSQAGTSTVPTALKDGEFVTVTLDPADTTPTASSVVVYPSPSIGPHAVSGRVTGVSGSVISLADRSGVRTFTVSSTTRYIEGSTPENGVTPGEFVKGYGSTVPSSASDFVASLVRISPRATPVTPGATHRHVFSPAPQPPVAPTPRYQDQNQQGQNEQDQHPVGGPVSPQPTTPRSDPYTQQPTPTAPGHTGPTNGTPSQPGSGSRSSQPSPTGPGGYGGYGGGSSSFGGGGGGHH